MSRLVQFHERWSKITAHEKTLGIPQIEVSHPMVWAESYVTTHTTLQSYWTSGRFDEFFNMLDILGFSYERYLDAKETAIKEYFEEYRRLKERKEKERQEIQESLTKRKNDDNFWNDYPSFDKQRFYERYKSDRWNCGDDPTPKWVWKDRNKR